MEILQVTAKIELDSSEVATLQYLLTRAIAEGTFAVAGSEEAKEILSQLNRRFAEVTL